MIRAARPGEEAAIDAFLAAHADSSMFLRSNLAVHGLDETEHPHGTRFYITPAIGEISAIFGRTNDGFLMCQAPQAGPNTWRGFADILQGQVILGMTGVDGQVMQALAALELPSDAFRVNHSEPLYRLDLARVQEPQEVTLRAPTPDDLNVLGLWYAQYMRDTGQAGETAADIRTAITRAVEAIAGGQVRLLIEDGQPVAMTGINARVGGMVQLGGVFTPPDRRGKGYARNAVAAQLAEERKTGTRVAVLFANNAAAARSYEAIGFKKVGTYRVAILKRACEIGVAA